MKKMVVLMALIGVVLFGSINQASAALGWQLCSVYAAGAGSGSYWTGLTFTNPTTGLTQNVLGYFVSPNEKEMLATALTAVANKQKVYAYFDPDAATVYIYVLYIYDYP